MKKIVWMTLSVLLLFTSCSDDDYLNTIPESSIALMSVDVVSVAKANGIDGDKMPNVLTSLLPIDNMEDSGLELEKRIFFFETADGFLGMAASLDDEKTFEKRLSELSESGVCQRVKEKRGIHYTLLKNAWLLAFEDSKLLIMGPVIASQQAVLLQQMARMFEQNEEQSVKGTPIYDKLESQACNMAFVAQAAAFPKMLVAPLTLGVPKDADPSQVMIAAKMQVADRKLKIEGELLSFNKSIDDAIKTNLSKLGTYGGHFNNMLSADALFSLFLNAKGEDLLGMVRANGGFQQLLTGINTAIDMDNILRSTGGDFVISAQSEKQIDIYAKLAKKEFLNDVGYWKQSCPSGSKIVDDGNLAWKYLSGADIFRFGVSDDYFFGHLNTSATHSVSLPLKEIDGKRFMLLFNLEHMDNETVSTVRSFMEPFFGKIEKVVYCLQ